MFSPPDHPEKINAKVVCELTGERTLPAFTCDRWSNSPSDEIEEEEEEEEIVDPVWVPPKLILPKRES